ncbi:MAG: PHP domain-containing protein [Caldimicrobium sp.]
MIDLHTHSTASDGTYSPRELVLLAIKEGLSALALTDHDTIDGLKEAYETAKEVGLSFLCGVEISVKFNGPGHFHLLGYFLTPEISGLKEMLRKLKEARSRRNELMIEKLQALGVEITLEELKNIASGEIGRPHIAKLLLEKGVVKTLDEAFERYLKKGAPAYVPKAFLTPEEAIEEILKNRGIPVMAHPVTLKVDKDFLKRYLYELKEKGLKGVEVFYTEHSPSFTQFLFDLVKKLDLLITGGSDFHGANKPDIKLGRGLGKLNIPFDCYKNLKEALENQVIP